MPRIIDVEPVSVVDTPLGLYIDDGRVISTHSMLKTFRRCPKQAEYKYVHRYKPRLLAKPLRRGTWLHLLLEDYHMGRDWEATHLKLSREFDKLFDEERDFYGDLPAECKQLMLSYIWHYKFDPWKVLETEFKVETEFPDGSIYRAKCDMLIENRFGLWLVDHKTHKTLPDHEFRLLDAQSALYLWACLRNKIPVEGFIWNYLRTKAPSLPKQLKAGGLSRRAIDTDYPTYYKEVKRLQAECGLKITPAIIDKANYLKSLRFQPDQPQLSTFFRRDTLEKQPAMLKEVALENYRTAKRMHTYDFSKAVERVVDTSCKFTCSYRGPCTVELMGGNIHPLIKQNYTLGDPLEYYEDRGGEVRDGDSR